MATRTVSFPMAPGERVKYVKVHIKARKGFQTLRRMCAQLNVTNTVAAVAPVQVWPRPKPRGLRLGGGFFSHA